MRRYRFLIGLAALVALGGHQASVGSASDREEGDRWQTRLRLFAPPPAVAPDPRGDGSVKLQIPSFGLIGRAGDVYLPVRILRVAIPEATGEVRLERLRARPVPLPGVDLPPPAPSERGYGTRGRPPAAPTPQEIRRSGADTGRPAHDPDFQPPSMPVRIGDVGWLRDQRFVEIVYTPVVSPRGGGPARFYGDIQVDLVVEGVPPGVLDGGPAAEDPHFEAAYRDSFVNYEQGRFLRSRGRRAPGRASMESAASAPSPAAAVASSWTTENGFPAYKLFVTEEGIYRLSHAYLLGPPGGEAPGLAGADPRQFKIMNRGIEIPIHVEGEGDGSFDPGDYIEFYGQGLDGPETLLNFDLGLLPNIYQLDDYGDENVYWLSVDGSGTRERIPARSAPPNGGFPLEPDFQEILHFEVDSLFLPTGGEDPFLMTPRLNSNSGSVPADPNTCVYSNPGVPSQSGGSYLGPGVTDPSDPHYCPVCRMGLPGINAAAAGTATVSVRMRGTTDEFGVDPDRLSVVEANGIPSQSSAFCWSGLELATQTLDLSHSALTDPLDIRIELPGLAATASTEQVVVDYTRVAYRRLFQALDDGLRFAIPDQDRRIAVSDLSTGDASQIALYEITGSLQPVAALGGPAIVSPVRVTGGSLAGGGGSFTLTFTNDDDPNGTVDRVYHLAGPGAGGLRLPVRVEEEVPSSLLDPTHEADVLVIGDPNVMDLSPASPFATYWSQRAAADGYAVEIVSIEDVDDEFGYGIHHPEAIRAFLGYAYDNWKGPLLDPNRPPPAFVALVGDTTADPKNNLNRSDWVNQVPGFLMFQKSAVLGFYVSDNYIASFRGTDQLPDVHLGRLTPRTAQEADSVFSKLGAYESPVSGAWHGRGIFVTDEGKSPGESSEFERITDAVIDDYWQPQPPHQAERIYYDEPEYGYGNDPAGILADIIAAMDAGGVLFQYTGHGAFSIYGVDGFMFSSDVASLSPTGGKYFFGINENCLSGGFHFLGGDALSEAFLKADDKGAVAFFAPAGLSFSFIGESINNRVYGDITGPARLRRFGELITNVRIMLSSFGAIIDQQSYTLVGDPTLRFALPAPAPPVGFAALSGNAHVDLSWSPSPDPNTSTLIYRASSPAGPYSLITPSPVPGTFHTDPNVVNAQNYFYRASSVDSEGYEGAVSHFNSDCNLADLPSSGPDCAWARPLNTVPPVTPSGAGVFSDGTGVRLEVAWSPNPETDIQAYVARYGTQQGGPYPLAAEANAAATGLFLNGLTTGASYFVRLSARNTSGLESAPTAEMEGIPLSFPGEDPPAFIDNLRIFPTPGDPASVTLDWDKPAATIYGGTTFVASYNVYREIYPGFSPAPSNRIAEINDPDVTEYVDVGAAAAPDPYFYLINARDVRGYAGGLGFELPDGVDDLAVEVINGGTTLRFTWSAAATSVTGGETRISHYALYADNAPVPRSAVDTMAPVVDNILTLSADLPVNPAQTHFTLIVVDTRGNKSPF